MDALSILKDQSTKTVELVDSLRPEQFGLPTPCTQWDVRALVNHLCLVAQFYARVAAGEQAEPDYETDFVGEDPAAAHERWWRELLEACAAEGLAERPVALMGGEFPGAVVLALALMDTVVHRWDLARAVGADPDIDPDVATLLLDQLKPLDSDAARAPAPHQTTGSIPMGPAVPVPDDASPVERLVAFLGRTP